MTGQRRRKGRDAEATLAALRRLQSRRREVIPTREIRKTRPVLYRDLLRHFGGARRARRRLGLPARVERGRAWSTERLVRELRRLHRDGVTASFWGLVRAGHRDVAAAAERLAGGLVAARRLAGIPEPSRRGAPPQPWTQRAIADTIRQRVRSGLPVALTKAPTRLVTAGRRHFGNWRGAVEAAGFDYDEVRLVRGPYTKRDLIAALRREASRYPDQEWKTVRQSAIGQAADRLYGGLEKALRAANLDRWPKRSLREVQSPAAILRAIRGRRRDGDTLQVRHVLKEAHWLAHGAIRRFGSWEAALEAAGVRPPVTPQKWTESTITRALRERRRSGKSLKAVDVRREDLALYSAAVREYGNYYAAAKTIGVGRFQERWSASRVRRELLGLGRKGSVSRRVAGVRLVNAAIRYFGSFAAAKRTARVA